MQRTRTFHDQEVVDERAVGAHRLGTYPCICRQEVLSGQLGDQALQVPQEPTSRQRPTDLFDAGADVALRQVPERR